MDCPFCGYASTYGKLLLGRLVCSDCYGALEYLFVHGAAVAASEQMGFTVRNGHHFATGQEGRTTPGYSGGSGPW